MDSLVWLVAGLLIFVGGCVILVRGVDVSEVPREQPPVSVASPVKAHLLDGGVVVFRGGVVFRENRLVGQGQRFSVDLTDTSWVSGVALDSVVAMETFKTAIRPGSSAALSLAATPVAFYGAAGLYVLLFGSCPTVYSQGVDGPILEAESFSNSISQLLETRDVDRLGVRANSSGVVELDVRNEALETHYINHLQLVEVLHESDELAVPGDRGKALLLRKITVPTVIVDRTGKDVARMLEAADGLIYRTDEKVLAAASPLDLMDHIDFVLPAPASDSAAVVLRVRNSLLNTVLFYEFMLAGQGARSLDWIGREMETIRTAVALGEFAARRMGLRVHVWEDGRFREIAKVGEVGPIAWEDVAVPVPVPSGDSLRIRLSFIADAWRIDRVALAVHVRSGVGRNLEPQEVLDAGRSTEALALVNISTPDENYVITGPGDRFTVRFLAGPEPAHGGRTFFLAAQGYYTEWIRPEWVKNAGSPTPFVASDETLHEVLKRWQVVKPSYEKLFEETKIPVR